MRLRIGISIDGDAIHAVAVRRRAVVWRGACIARSRDGLRDDISALLKPCPRAKHSRAVAVLGSGHARVKPLRGFEKVSRPELVDQAILANPERFFLREERGLVFSHAFKGDGGVWHVAAFSRATTLAAEGGCIDASVELVRCLARVTGPSMSLPEDLDVEFGRAYQAATEKGRSQFYSNSDSTNSRIRLRRRMRRRLLGGLIAAACIAVLIAPTISAERLRRAATAQLEEARIPLRPVAASMAALAKATSMLRRIDEFDRSRQSMLRYLSSLSDALPESTAVLSMRVDTATATTVIVTRSGPSVLGEFAAMPQLVAPRLIGAVSREQIGGVEYDRLAVRAQLVRARDTVATAGRER